MFLFLPDLVNTNSHFLKILKVLFEFDSSYTDKKILQTFTIPLAGFDDTDQELNLTKISQQIETFQKEKYIEQSKIAEKMLFSEEGSVVKHLKKNQLILIGFGFGGLLSLYFTANRFRNVSHLVLVNFGEDFNWLKLWKQKIEFKKLQKLSRQKLTQKMLQSSDLLQKTKYNFVLENPQLKGVFSALNLMSDFNFRKYFQTLSITQQLEFSDLPILTLHTKKPGFTSYQSVQNFGKIIKTKFKVKTKNQKIVISKNRSADSLSSLQLDLFQNVVYKTKEQSLLEKYFFEIADDLKEFLK